MNDIVGTFDNGSRHTLAFRNFTGTAGVRRRDGGREVAFFGAAPRTFPVKLTLDDEEVQATSTLEALTDGFTVLWVPDQ